MARTCPDCGSAAIDDQSMFCNKCGSPFPEDRPKKVVVRTTPRLADVPSPKTPQPVHPPAPESRVPPVPPVRSLAEPPRVRVPTPVQRPALPGPVRSGALPFRWFLAGDFLKPIYWVGVIAIVLIVGAGISTGTTPSATAADTKTGTGTTSSGDLLSGIPLFWIGVFIFANLVWRVQCETGAMVYAGDTLPPPGNTDGAPSSGMLPQQEIPDYRDLITEEPVQCPRCGNVVPRGDLRSCEHCGVQGCTSCIRMMGLLRKTLTCKDCFENK